MHQPLRSAAPGQSKMWNGFCGDLIRRINQHLLVAVLVVGVGLLLFFGVNRAYFFGFFAGPHNAGSSELLTAKKTGDFPNAIVKVAGGITANANFAEYTKDDAHPNGYISARYLMTEIGGKLLLVRVDPDTPLAQDGVTPVQWQPSGMFTGQIHAFSEKTQAAVERANETGSSYLPYYLDAYQYKSFGWISVVAGSILLIWALWGFWQYLQRNADPANHPFAKRLARYGALESIVPQLDAEMSAAHTTFNYRVNTAYVTTGWYLVVSTFTAKAAPLSAVLWVYKKIVKRRIYFVIPAGTQQSLVAYDRFGTSFTVQLKEIHIAQLMQLLRNLSPDAIYGYDKRVMKLWQPQKRNCDRSAFVTEARTMLAGHALPEALTTRR